MSTEVRIKAAIDAMDAQTCKGCGKDKPYGSGGGYCSTCTCHIERYIQDTQLAANLLRNQLPLMWIPEK